MIVMISAQKAVLSLFQSKDLFEKEKCIEYLETFSEDKYIKPNVDILLKHSQYNTVKNKKQTYIVYNTLFNSMITLSESEFKQYINIKFSDLSIVEALVDNGFLIPNYVNEYERYDYYKQILLRQPSDISHYTVALTSKCNAKCFYCYEEGIKKYDMTLKTAKRFAENLLNSKKSIDITWFGGEPMLKMDIITYISEILNDNKRDFQSGLITNGSLLSEEIIKEKFPVWNVNWVQITLDGLKEEYLKRKQYSCNLKEVYDTVQNNIDLLLRNKINVSIRLNVDVENKEDCFAVANHLKSKYSDNKFLYVYPAFLYGQTDPVFSESERVEYSSRIYDLYSPERSLLTYIPKINSCFINQQGSFVIDTDGSILGCDGDIGKRHTKFSNVFSIDNFDNLEKPESVIPKVRNMCESCVYYPKCGGGCMNTYSNPCKYDACFQERYKIEYLLNKIIDF